MENPIYTFNMWMQMCVAVFIIALWLPIFLINRKKNRPGILTEDPELTVIVPVKNEEKFILDTIEKINQAVYSRKINIIVVDDGSTDRTAEILATMGERIQVITHRISTGCKALAVNSALKNVRTDFTVIIDSDTQVREHTFSDLMTGFSSDQVAAVSCLVDIKNKRSLLTLFQRLDYLIGMFLRFIQDKLLAVPTIIGVCTAIRTDVLRKIGGLPADTLAEDGDLCAVLKKQGLICRTINSFVDTIAPENLRTLFKQRSRWIRGRIQISLKHKDMFFNRRHGLFGWLTFPYEFLILLLGFISVPLAWTSCYFFINSHVKSLLKFYHNLTSQTRHGAGFVFKFNFFDWISIFYFLTIALFIFLAIRTLKYKHKFSYYVGAYFYYPYILFLLGVIFIAFFSEVYARARKRKLAWGTR